MYKRQLSIAEIPAHSHTLTDPGHAHSIPVGGSALSGSTGNAIPVSTNTVTGSATTGVTINNTGGGGAHNIMQPFVLGTFYRKL